ncbi:MAG TPA: peptidylprolyl isomerase, partial [Planctomycetaceae bacterium]|nr:peptidylprolyl isomerase [Planctomycetaceae bacterium]
GDSTDHGPGDSTDLRFNRDIRPILTDRCFACHGPDAKTVEGGLRLDLPAEAIEATEAIVPGDADASEVIRRIFSDDEDEVMPPPELHKPLTDGEKEILRRWVEQGAEYEPHWAYTPMRESEFFKDSETYIDRHLDRAIDAAGLRPSPPADPVTLLRRLSIDLTGLPPTPAELDAFLKDPSPAAYLQQVERLLDSPRYGERMAVYWLDLVRYADTVGYHGDQNVMQYPYRDYVINAFNRNLSYDNFIRQQLAGDLLNESSPEIDHLVASGYNRLNQTTEEGGSQAKEYLAIYFADRVRNVSQVFMGATLGCAQCHDHKYDPYTTRDFYSFGAFFADLEERGVYSARSRPPTIPIYSAETKAELARLDEAIRTIEQDLASEKAEALSRQSDWEATIASSPIGQTKWHSHITNASDAKKLGAKDWKFVDADQVPVAKDNADIVAGGPATSSDAPPQDRQVRVQSGDSVVQHTYIDKKSKIVVDLSTRITTQVFLAPEDPPKAIMLQINDGDWEQRVVWGSDDIPYGRRDDSWAGYNRQGELLEVGSWHQLEFSAIDVGLKPGDEIIGLAFTQYGGTTYWDDTGWTTTDGPSAALKALLAVPASERTAETRKIIEQHYLTKECQPLITLNERLQTTISEREELAASAPTTVVSRSVKPRTIRILPRGNWMDDSGDIVLPAIPAFLGELDSQSGERLSRLDLANWLCEPDNPLTARTMVNRIWALLFGRGICSSVDDFGGQGTYPSNPELLDDLALDFVRSGWDIKAIVKRIVTSEAYQRSSLARPRTMEADPYNDLFARQGRFRVPAEVVRDIALYTSGLLVEQVGGPSARPYQPAGYYAQLNFPRREYEADTGPSQY